jgi:pimeloyl-ACP methyl ester carboxylesterase
MKPVLERSETANREARAPGDGFDAVIFVHGFLDSQMVWKPLIEALSNAGVEAPASAVDLRGAGERREEDDNCTLAQAVLEVERLFDEMHLSRVALVGHSMGTQIAELVASERPQQVAALVLVTPTPLAGNVLPDDVRALLRESGADPAAQRAIRVSFSKNLTDDQLDELVEPNMLMGKQAVRQYYDAFSIGDPRGEVPCTYHGPTLVIGAQDDPVIPPEQISAIHRERFSDADLRMIAHSGHWPHLEQPLEMAKIIAAHLGTARFGKT